MTNEPINMTATNDRRLAQIRAEKAAYAAPIMPSTIRRPPPRTRRNSVPHRAIR
jgi:hypothetical protein